MAPDHMLCPFVCPKENLSSYHFHHLKTSTDAITPLIYHQVYFWFRTCFYIWNTGNRPLSVISSWKIGLRALRFQADLSYAAVAVSVQVFRPLALSSLLTVHLQGSPGLLRFILPSGTHLRDVEVREL